MGELLSSENGRTMDPDPGFLLGFPEGTSQTWGPAGARTGKI
jgi:hypothetical protein